MGRVRGADLCSIGVAGGDLSEKCLFSQVQKGEIQPWCNELGQSLLGRGPSLLLSSLRLTFYLFLSLAEPLFSVVFWLLISLVCVWPCLSSSLLSTFLPLSFSLAESLFLSLSLLVSHVSSGPVTFFFSLSLLCISLSSPDWLQLSPPLSPPLSHVSSIPKHRPLGNPSD